MATIHVKIHPAEVEECDHLTAGAFCAPCVAEAQQAATRALTESQMDPGLKLLESELADSSDSGEDVDSAEAEEDVPDTVRFSGPIGFENQMTGDGRYIASGALRAETPIPLRYVPQDTGGHEGAYVVGLIESMTTADDGTIMGDGFIDTTTPQGMEVYRGMNKGTIGGISMDLDDMDYEVYARNELLDEAPAVAAEAAAETPFDGYTKVTGGNSDDVVFHINSARVRGATLVQIPAFADARISLVASIESDDMEALDAVTEEFGASGLPLSDREASWDAAAARKTLGDDPAAAGWAFFIKDGPSDQWGSYHLPFARVEGGKRVAVWRGVTAAAAAVQGARGASGFGSAKGAIASYYAAARKKYNDDSITPPWSDSGSAGANTVTASAPVHPPAAWFDNPRFKEPTPLTFTKDGRVFGHIAIWGTCHTGFPGACVQPPRSNTNYAYFRTGILVTDEGTEVPVGHLTMETGHAGPNMSAAAAMAHYDNTGLVAADVAAGDDEHGIWVSGALRPDLSDEEIRDLRSAPMSGDWRRIGGNLELMAVLAVNLPGFPVLRTKALVASGATQSLFVPIESEKTEMGRNESLIVVSEEISGRFAALEAQMSRIKRAYLSMLMEKE